MNSRWKWDPAKIRNEISNWVRDPFNEDFMYRRPVAKLGEAVAQDRVQAGQASEALTSLSKWFLTRGAAGILEGDRESRKDLHRSFWCDLLYSRLMWSHFDTEARGRQTLLQRALTGPKARHGPRLSFNEQGLLLAHSITLGYSRESGAIFERTLSGKERGLLYGVNETEVAPFVLALFRKWRGREPRAGEESPPLAEPYAQVLTFLLENSDDFERAVVSACEFHIARSKEHDDSRSYEFADPVYMIYPVEILAAFQVRRSAGLPVNQNDHPLLMSPLGLPPEKLSFPMEPLFEALAKKLEIELPLG